MRWRLDCRPRTPARHDLRRDISECRRADSDRADSQELLDLRQHRLQAHLARSLLHLSKDRTLALVDVGVGRVDIVVDGDKHPDPKLGVDAQPPRDPRGQRVFTSAQSRADDSIDPPGSRRLDPLAVTAREQLLADALGTTLDLRDMLDQPRRQLLGIGNRALAKAEVLADLRAMMLDRAPRPNRTPPTRPAPGARRTPRPRPADPRRPPGTGRDACRTSKAAQSPVSCAAFAR